MRDQIMFIVGLVIGSLGTLMGIHTARGNNLMRRRATVRQRQRNAHAALDRAADDTPIIPQEEGGASVIGRRA